MLRTVKHRVAPILTGKADTGLPGKVLTVTLRSPRSPESHVLQSVVWLFLVVLAFGMLRQEDHH